MSRASTGGGADVELLHRLVGGDGGAALEALLEGFTQQHPGVPLSDVTNENLSLTVKSRILKEDPRISGSSGRARTSNRTPTRASSVTCRRSGTTATWSATTSTARRKPHGSTGPIGQSR
ncbi:hypothetical protein ACFQL1_01210 [Halomicroarcula sp. GCM10025709]|uniref:hypothetical protein n=1 Tax=Halomicroarcula sp. GCM10025709 TaxID=3252669 RepID=UPI003607E5B2